MTSRRAQGDKDEKRFAKKHGGKRVAGSGSSREKKGDVKVGEFLVQNKSTIANSIAVKLRDLQDIQEQALNCGKLPAYVMSFYTGHYPMTWVAVPDWLARQMGLLRQTLSGEQNVSTSRETSGS